jgi:hypothetical protein
MSLWQAEDGGLAVLAGEWSGVERIAPSKWGPGGEAQVRIVAREALGARILVQDYQAQRDGKAWLQAHAVFVRGAEAGRYELHWFDSFGFAPAQPAPGRVEGGLLVFLRSSPRGQTRHSYALVDRDHWTLKLESSFDQGASWSLVSEGSYVRVA